jgi:hypothetical protein
VLAVLQRAIDAKEKVTAELFSQLRVKDEQIAALNERLRESNVLMQSLQKQLPEPAGKTVPLVGAVKPATPKRSEKGFGSSPKSKRRSWVRRLFAA